jgi:hypothetical protein
VERFALEGYVVEELIGFGGTGEVWRAREVATGETVALKRLRARGAAAADRLRREAGLLAAVAGPHVIGLRRMVVDDDEAVMVLDYAAGGNLATVLAVRGTLPAPEVVTVIAPIATALAAAHARDLAHGDLTPANILFAADGRPLLADFGVARAVCGAAEAVEATVDYLAPEVAAGGQPTPASDVFALGAVAFAALAGQPVWGTGSHDELTRRAAHGRRPGLSEIAPQVPAALAAAVETMLAVDPLDRPDARSSASAVLRASAVAPIGLVPTTSPLIPPVNPTRLVQPAAPRSMPFDRPIDDRDDDEGDDERDWTPWRRRVVIAGAAGLALTGAIGVGVSLASSGRPAAGGADPAPAASALASRATTAPTTPAAVTNWTAVVTHLDQLRAEAFSEGDAAALARVYAPSSAAYATDVETLRSLASRGLHAQGFTATVQQVRVESATATSGRLRVVDRLSGYQLVDGAGTVVGHGDPRPPTAFTMRLTRVGGAWRVAAVQRR